MQLPDDILGAILERIDSQVFLLRAASVSKRWRNIIADAAFLHRFRSLQAPAVAGEYYCKYPLSFIPSSSSSSIAASHHSLDFLPDHDGEEEYWRLVDNRGSLLLMRHLSDDRYLVPCEPLTRRYKRIRQPLELIDDIWCSGVFYLIDGAGEDEAGSSSIGMSNFRVVCEHYMDHTMHVMVLDPDDDGNDTLTSAWIEKDASSIVEAGVRVLSEVGRAAGSYYFCDADRCNILVILDGRTGEFSAFTLPPSKNWVVLGSSNYCVTEGRDGKPRVCSVPDRDGSVKVFALRDDGECALEKTLLLGEAVPGFTWFNQQCLRLEKAGPRFIVLSLSCAEEWTVSVDLETMEVVPGEVDMGPIVYRCELPWPPMLNPCVDKIRR